MRFEVSRRGFIAGLGAGLAVALIPKAGGAVTPRAADGLGAHVLVHVALDGLVTIVCHRSEMGQGVRSSLPVLIGDELGVDPKRVVVQQAVGDAKYGDQNTDGSTSIRRGYDELRTAGAVTRMLLVAAAAKRWKVKPATCTAEQHRVVHAASKRSLGFEEVVAAASKLPVPKTVVMRPVTELTRVATPNLPVFDGLGFVTGTAKFGGDLALPGLVYAAIARPPVVGGKVAKLDASKALAVPGVTSVIEMPPAAPPWLFQPWGGVAVIATNTWAALKGRAALAIAWEHGDFADYSWPAYREQLLASVRAPGEPHRNVGDVDQAFAKAAQVVEAEYIVPHLSHLQMEPLVATARVAGDTCEVWVPTQHPQANRDAIAKLLGLPLEAVTVNVTLLGGAFGRKSKSDFVVEAAYIAKQLGDNVPVRVQWTREDDVKHGYYNAANAQRLRAALDAGKQVTGWHHRTALTPIGGTMNLAVDGPGEGDLQQGVADLALGGIPNVRAEACKAPVRTRVGWYRSVYNIFHAFAVGSFIDEIAHARGADPRATWLEVIGPAKALSLQELGVKNLRNYGEKLAKHPVDAGRLRHVIERVTELANWSDRNGRFLGLAAHRSFVSYTGVVVSVVADPEHGFRIEDVWITMDAGMVVNQERVHSQLEGAVIMGISNVLYGGITHTAGVVDQTNFRDARVVRIHESPRRIHTDIVASPAPPSGVGEPGVPPVGAALANALFALTGKRLREVPFVTGVRS